MIKHEIIRRYRNIYINKNYGVRKYCIFWGRGRVMVVTGQGPLFLEINSKIKLRDQLI